MYKSDTEQIQSPHAWTFAALEIDEDGGCIAAERKGLRKIKEKGLIVRYANPFNKPTEPQVLYRVGTEGFQGLCQAPNGDLHAVGKERHHTNASGKWLAKKVVKNLQNIWVSKAGNVFIHYYATEPTNTLLEQTGKSFTPVETGMLGETTGIDGSGDTLYVAGAEGMAHFDGNRWSLVEKAPWGGALSCIAHDEVLSTGIHRKIEGVVVSKGNAHDGFGPLIHRDDCGLELGDGFNKIVRALGKTFLTVTHGYKRGLWQLDGGKVTQVMAATGYTGAASGNADTLWVSNGIELLCSNGKEWRSVERVFHSS